MSKKTEMAETFYVPTPGEFVPEFIARHIRRTPWKRQSVAVLIFSPRRDKVALCLPRKVLEREGENRIRVPLQGRFMSHNVNPVDEARDLLHQKAGIQLPVDAITYLGFGFTRSFRTNELTFPYNKLLHVAHCALAHERRLPSATKYAAHLEWFHLDALKSIAEASMDTRKAWLFFAALKQVATEHTPYAQKLRIAIGAA